MRLIDADALKDPIELQRASYERIGATERAEAYANVLWEIDEAPTVGGWISVKDRLPEKSGQYLCWFGANKVVIGPAIETYVDEWKAFGELVSLEKYPNITHWMPLPEPPRRISHDSPETHI